MPIIRSHCSQTVPYNTTLVNLDRIDRVKIIFKADTSALKKRLFCKAAFCLQ